jgi:hypothetical protein
MKTKLGYFIGSGITILWILFFYQYVLFHQRIKELDLEAELGSPDAKLVMKMTDSPNARRIALVEKDLESLEKENQKVQQYVDRVREGEWMELNYLITITNSSID